MSSLDLIGYLIWLNTRQLSPAPELGWFCLAIEVRIVGNPLCGSIATAGGTEGWRVSDRGAYLLEGACPVAGDSCISLAGYVK